MVKKKTKNFTEVVQTELDAGPELKLEVEQQRLLAEIAQWVYQARKEKKLTQYELAKKLGVKTSLVAKIEDADYDGISLRMVQHIASIFNKRVFVMSSVAKLLFSVSTGRFGPPA
jgi:ribosome-binding protein aMBF1 (putative translation factor)